MSVQAGNCPKCGKHGLLLYPLHGDKGGPLTCMTCGMDWHAEHGRLRKLGRVVVKAIKAYEKAGGSWQDVNRLHLAAGGFPLYADEEDRLGADVGDITLELLEDAARLTHPDRHPPERQESAKRVTQELLALKPFVFPAPKEKTPEPVARNAFIPAPRVRDTEPLRISYPCELCRNEIPYYYCKDCRAKFDEIQRKERERRREKQRKAYARQKMVREWRRAVTTCAPCGKQFKGKRKDSKYCSAACRQRAHRGRVTDKGRTHGEPIKSRYAEAAA